MTVRSPSQRPAPRSQPPAPLERRRGRLRDKRITLAVSGSIAAYKAVLLARLLVTEGAQVQTLFTRAASQFVGAATFAGITGKPVLTDMFDPAVAGELHVDLASKTDLLLVIPATADLLARLAGGRADDLITATALCAACPILVAPAMHPAMWAHPATQRNVELLTADGRVERVGPVYGEVASGEHGIGRMSEPEEILAAVLVKLAEHDLRGRHVVVTAGPTIEDIDPVRFLSNRSSGKMGFAVAERAAARGARVTLITGPAQLPTPYGVTRVDVRSAVAMRGAVWQALGPDLGAADALVMAAAVGDYRPAETHATKLKREGDQMRLELVQNPDILAEIGAARAGRRPVLVGFAVEADKNDKVVAYARAKLGSKKVDVVVANHADDSFGKDDNRVSLVTQDRVEPLPRSSKLELADQILDFLARRLEEQR
ncbi:MAG: bifunctional phosphopantothenoylcysteine decarboxylase/phosphopantothenate--cysteine ligase CoaBC [Polyangiaceae bacterium]|nr:bifunctional phosphopantothenoylcysteine decarboxylase/phosphopantothenate--cysteine ligase CoaBC [Polyangiaceae bacterium]MCE7888728.1 bifunctional phosphopantothenoylcysteine decarboxylase/phosphopantothenate--cysteine ligase CoaBC [Sorangiineae bacterium PRO1]MCL4753755.1 bifunctional phosphopantothenoylcysteine decarboxylase/phosphopantothenate--cysteine ligase CoaBC [Myxococcales bacterium]